MKNDLQELIDAYRAKAFELVPRLSKALDFALPITNIEWAGLAIPHRGRTNNGLHYFKHGVGVTIKFDGGEIDIDFGKKGEYDGFDGWRLLSFAEKSFIRTSYKDLDELEVDIKNAEAKGQIRFSGGSLYYLNNNR